MSDQGALKPGSRAVRSGNRQLDLDRVVTRPRNVRGGLSADGATRLDARDLLSRSRPDRLPPGWLMAAYWGPKDVHFRRVDVDGRWSEKQGSTGPRQLGRLSLWRLLLYKSGEGDRCGLIGLFWWPLPSFAEQ